MAGAGDDGDRRPSGSTTPIASAMATNLASRAPATRSTGIGKRRQQRPQRLLRARPGEAQAGGQTGGRVVQSGRASCGAVGRQVGEQRKRQPVVEEGSDAVAFDARGESLVVGSPGVPGRRRRRGRRWRSTRTSRCTMSGSATARWSAQAPAHRVADVRRPAAGATECRRHRRAGRGAASPIRRDPGRRRGSPRHRESERARRRSPTTTTSSA